MTDEKIESVETLLPALEIAAREGRPFVVVAENIEGQALAALIMNAMRGTMRVCGIKAPVTVRKEETLKDLALSVGATFVSRQMGKKLKSKTYRLWQSKTFRGWKKLDYYSWRQRNSRISRRPNRKTKSDHARHRKFT